MKWMCLIVLTVLVSCSWGGRSDGLTECPNEVLVIDDSAAIVTASLSKSFPALPDSEPMFNVRSISRSDFKSLEMYRPLIVRISINPKQKHTEIAYSNNMYAREQIVVTLRAASYTQLQRDLASQRLTRLLHQQVIKRESMRMKAERRNPLADSVKRSFGISIAIPPIVTRIKHSHDFVWLSSADGEYTFNLCFYRSENRDSVMRENIKGQSDSQYMVTTPQTTLIRHRHIEQTEVTEHRGLWHMQGDAMGGSYLSFAFNSHGDGQKIVAEVFVYAPSRSKRDLMREAEAVLTTIFMDKNHS